VDLGEGLNEAIHRELFEETGLSLDHIEPKLLDVEIQQFQP
jgi:NUDIX domain